MRMYKPLWMDTTIGEAARMHNGPRMIGLTGHAPSYKQDMMISSDVEITHPIHIGTPSGMQLPIHIGTPSGVHQTEDGMRQRSPEITVNLMKNATLVAGNYGIIGKKIRDIGQENQCVQTEKYFAWSTKMAKTCS